MLIIDTVAVIKKSSTEFVLICFATANIKKKMRKNPSIYTARFVLQALLRVWTLVVGNSVDFDGSSGKPTAPLTKAVMVIYHSPIFLQFPSIATAFFPLFTSAHFPCTKAVCG